MKKFFLLLCLISLNSAANAQVSSNFLGTDVEYKNTTIQGNWVGVVGEEGYHLLYWGGNENQASYPSYLNKAQRVNMQTWSWKGVGQTDEAKAVTDPAGDQRAATCWVAEGMNYIHIGAAADCSFIMGIYLLDYDNYGPRKTSIDVCDATEETTPTNLQTVESYGEGAWLFYEVSARAGDTISIVVNNLNSNSTVSMLSFDKPSTMVDSFAITDSTSGCPKVVNEPFVNVELSGQPVEGAAITGYMITESPETPAADSTDWSPIAPVNYLFTADEGEVTLYGWVLDNQGSVAGKAVSFLYSTAVPAVSDFTIFANASDSAVAQYTTSSLTAGRLKYRAVGAAEWSYSNWNAVTTSHSIAISGLARSTSYEIVVQNGDFEKSPVVYDHLVGLVEIAKNSMKVYTNNIVYGKETDAINGNISDVGWHGNSGPGYFMLELEHRATIAALEYQPRIGHPAGRTKDYELYVTDDPDAWGTPIAAGTWADGVDKEFVPFEPTAGRFFIFRALTPITTNIGAAELWLYGNDAPDVTGFTVADRNTGNTHFIGSPIVDVTEFTADGAGETVTGYMITEAGDIPAEDDTRWNSTPPAEYVITGAPAEENPRDVYLYGWILTDAGSIANSSALHLSYTTLALAEVPKNEITARAGSIGHGKVANAIDGNPNNFWLTHEMPAWLQLDLGGRYTVGSFTYQGRTDSYDARCKNYEIYVTDVPDDQSAWGEPVAAGTLQNTFYKQEITTAARTGRYVIFNGIDVFDGNWQGANEVSVYGEAAVEVADFEVADQTTGSTMFINVPVVDVSAFEVETYGEAVTGYLITQDDDFPLADDTRWSDQIPDIYVITGEAPAIQSRRVTLRAWVQTESGIVGSSEPLNLYLTELPLAEIPKNEIEASASETGWGVPASMLNGGVGDYWIAPAPGNYLQLDLGGRYNVGHIGFMNRIDDFGHRSKDYNIYVTDTPDQLSGLAASGTFDFNEQRQEIVLQPTVGRYVIVELLSNWGGSGAGGSEIWVYGTRTATITDFQVADIDTGSSLFINSQTVAVPAFEVDAAGDSVTHYLVTEPGDTPRTDDERWQTEKPTTYTFPVEPQTDSWVELVGWTKTFSGQLVVSKPCRVFYTPLPMVEVPKSQMKVTGSNTYDNYLDLRAINDIEDTGWICPGDSGRLLLDLGSRYNVGMFVYLARPDASDGNIQDYNIYVTDDPESWGAPVAVGTWPRSADRQWTTLSAREGRYVILEALSKYSTWISVGEVEIYGVPAADVPEFSVADQTTGSAKFITSTTVDVTSFVSATGDDPVVAYAIAADPYVPADDDAIWQGSVPSTHTIQYPPNKNEHLYIRGWVKTSSGNIACSKAQRLFYSDYEFTEIPKEQLQATATSESFGTVHYPAGRVFDGAVGNELQSWLGEGIEQWLQVDLGEGSTYTPGYIEFFPRQNFAHGWIKDYEIYVTDDPANWGEALVTGQLESNRTMQPIFVPPTSGRYVVFNILTNYAGDYDCISELTLYSAQEVQTQPTWPIEGDANMDCKVNIIDLIFVRNRLNGDVASDDNWQADVNGDGKINIIDLIYVRNRLNTRCD